LSDHSIGISVPIAAVAIGATLIEKHITIDRKMKGSDQQGSLEAEGVWRMMRDIRCLELALGKEELFYEPAVEATRIKLERSISSCRRIPAGEIITEDDMILLSPGDGLRWEQRGELLGRTAVKDIPEHEHIMPSMVR
jgi:sialic acid synthase